MWCDPRSPNPWQMSLPHGTNRTHLFLGYFSVSFKLIKKRYLITCNDYFYMSCFLCTSEFGISNWELVWCLCARVSCQEAVPMGAAKTNTARIWIELQWTGGTKTLQLVVLVAVQRLSVYFVVKMFSCSCCCSRLSGFSPLDHHRYTYKQMMERAE